MRAYYGTQISENQTRTPEGYLICRNVPLCRTGWYEYTAEELGLDADGMVKVYRSPEEVFDPAAVASFEGKSMVDGHPAVYPLSIDSEAAYGKGHVQNVRRGSGGYEDCVVGDLFIKDPVLANKVENGMRDVSCGYDFICMPLEDGTYAQRQIRGNHVAIVPKGRAGDRVSIRDELPEKLRERRTIMIQDKKQLLKHIFSLGLCSYAKDAKPEEMASVAEAMKEEGDCHGKDALPPDAGGGNQMMEMMQQILAALKQLVESGKEVHKEVQPNALDALEAELEKPNKETATDDGAEIPVIPEEDKPKNPIPGADSKAAILAAVRTMKPVIALIPDEGERKKATDALIASFRGMMAPGSQAVSYGDLLKTKKAEDKKAEDRKAADEEYGKKLKEKYHRKSIVGGA